MLHWPRAGSPCCIKQKLPDMVDYMKALAECVQVCAASRFSMTSKRLQLIFATCVLACTWALLAGAVDEANLQRATYGPQQFAALSDQYTRQIRPLMEKFCFECHSGDAPEADLDLSSFKSTAEIHSALKSWQKALEMLDSGQMPPKKAKLQPSDEQRAQLRGWVRDYLKMEAKAQAGDPGPVVLRRLSNAEYTYTIQDL